MSLQACECRLLLPLVQSSMCTIPAERACTSQLAMTSCLYTLPLYNLAKVMFFPTLLLSKAARAPSRSAVACCSSKSKASAVPVVQDLETFAAHDHHLIIKTEFLETFIPAQSVFLGIFISAQCVLPYPVALIPAFCTCFNMRAS